MIAAAIMSVLLVGDSLTAPATDPGGPIYSEMLPHEVTNIAIPGTSLAWWSMQAEERIEPELPADVVTILLGSNDAAGLLLPQPTPVDTYGILLRWTAERAIDGGAGRGWCS